MAEGTLRDVNIANNHSCRKPSQRTLAWFENESPNSPTDTVPVSRVNCGLKTHSDREPYNIVKIYFYIADRQKGISAFRLIPQDAGW